ncbi:MAG: Inner membrane transport protein YajR [Chloroflexi bacterium ADurb.Bin180]|nr:MAG: Inner membrane transport protein YajR [Chloroflexi bacterium ADurb.Bin180]
MIDTGKQHRLLLAAYCVAVSCFWAAQHVYSAFLPVYAKDIGASLTLVGIVVAGYGFVQSVLRIPLGMISDRWRRRKPFVLAGFSIIVVSCLGLASSPAPEWLAVFRTLAGVAASFYSSVAVLFVSYFPRRDAVRAVSLVAFFQQFGLVIASVLGALVAGRYGYIGPFYAGAVLATIGLLLVLRAPEESTERGEPVRLQGLLKTITEPGLLLVSVIGAMLMYVNYVVNGFVPVYAEQLGANAAQIGWLVAGGQIAATVTALAAGWLVQARSERTIIIVALAGLTLSILASGRSSSLAMLALARCAYGLCYGPIYPLLTGLSIKTVAPGERASAMSVFQAVYALGMWGGPLVSGMLAERIGLSSMLMVTSVMSVMAGVATWAGVKERRVGT